jgi:hypothetical protein
VEPSKVLARALLTGLPLDTSHHLSDENKIDDQGRGQERILAHIEDADGLVTTHEDLRIILIQSTLVVSNSWHILNNNAVIRVLTFLIKHIVSSNHIIDNIGFGDLLGAELLLGGQVFAVVVAEMVVGCDGGQFDTGADEKVDEGRFHLGLTGLEVVTANEGFVLIGEIDAAWDKGVLRRTVNEGGAFQNTGNGEDSGWRDLLVSALDGLDEVVGSVVDANNEVSETLSVGSPLDNDLIEVVGSFEVAYDC